MMLFLSSKALLINLLCGGAYGVGHWPDGCLSSSHAVNNIDTHRSFCCLGKQAGASMLRLTRFCFLWLFLLCLPSATWAQYTGTHHTILSSGGTIVVSDGNTISYSIGQSVYRHFGASPLIEEGIQHGFCIPQFDTLSYEICQGVADTFLAHLPSGYTLPNSVALNVPGRYEFTIHLLTEGGCDSVLFCTLTVHPDRDTVLNVQTTDCYNWFGRDYTESGRYVNHLPTTHGCDSTLSLQLTVIEHLPLPKIWNYNNEILFVEHRYDDYDDARYDDYRWYHNDVLVRQDTAADKYFNPDGSPLNGCYYLEVPTDASKTEWVRSNTICIGPLSIGDASEADFSLSLYPNPQSVGQVVYLKVSLVETLLQGASFKVFDVQGRQLLQRAARQQNAFVCDFPAGVYSVHLILANGRHEAHKLVVR